MATRKPKTPPIPQELPAEPEPSDDATPTSPRAPASQPQQQGAVALAGPPAGRATDRSVWQRLLDHQLEGYEAAIEQLEQLGRQQLELAQGCLDDTIRMGHDSLGWFVGLSASGARDAVALTRTVAAILSRPVA
ncbi:MAG: hypothetical protein CVU56_15190 [Deltaproteobacteria bacterium HGW-Deltaproteobacteria-14]|jgi:hypothetical protein|nr:MAG: hypothetical protein CVU56_15190 [Deltaproteobacteria bacterium HGW-Deltaproteobacteria-14]